MPRHRYSSNYRRSQVVLLPFFFCCAKIYNLRLQSDGQYHKQDPGYEPVTCISDYDLPGYARTISTDSATDDPNGDEHENYGCKCAHTILPRDHVESHWYRYEVIGDHEDLHYHTKMPSQAAIAITMIQK